MEEVCIWSSSSQTFLQSLLAAAHFHFALYYPLQVQWVKSSLHFDLSNDFSANVTKLLFINHIRVFLIKVGMYSWNSSCWNSHLTCYLCRIWEKSFVVCFAFLLNRHLHTPEKLLGVVITLIICSLEQYNPFKVILLLFQIECLQSSTSARMLQTLLTAVVDLEIALRTSSSFSYEKKKWSQILTYVAYPPG